jgi:hypothetical protein
MCYDVTIMIARTQITLDPETQRRARKRAAELGISFAEYIRQLVARDLGEPRQQVHPSAVFNLGNSGGADIAREKDALVGEAMDGERKREGDRG